ncbi:MAG: cation-efflux pump, partial [Clostridia bacterium]|nr:cation-efflux pump [Clostridia bacterium]
DEETNMLKNDLINVLKNLDTNLSLHDFRVVKGFTHTNVIFDVVMPFDASYSQEKIKEIVNEKLQTYEKKYYAVIEFDTNFND